MIVLSTEHMLSPKGSPVPNQLILHTEEGKYFQSYQTIIAFIPKTGKVQLDKEKWGFSNTTGVYRNQFLAEDIKQTRKKIKAGEYILTNLNSKKKGD